ncbi:hypothetical protein IR148_13265 [Dysgonomonas mossii]|uniref:Competence protein n=1 Tax=Dysgonomonas mossii TaxID=163665 RepID=A0A4Y9IK34_9BACT|nr:DUF6035 family protein [Dysgonomonas mossii]MBF0762008.1 hypothetical protein [Dysgonomonas mossii]TFU88830.1 hypothetical protein E4T88_13255 [Dysgonomonas mossii]
MENKFPTIEEVINQEDGEWNIIKSIVFFKDQHLPTRKFELFKIRQHIVNKLNEGNPAYICSYCKIPVKISGGSQGERIQSLHFRHAYRSPNCIYHDLSNYTKDQILCMKFNGAKEGFLHEYLKNTIASIIENDKDYSPLKVEIEKIVRSESLSKEWRKPDIKAIYSDKEVVFELQIATTFVDVILARSNFYKREKSYLIWVLDKFSTNLKEQTFSQTDILVSSNSNVFVFDNEMEELSKKANELHLKCHYIYHKKDKNRLSSPLWDSKIVTLRDICYDEKYRAFSYDTEGKKEELLREIEVKKEERRQQFYHNSNLVDDSYNEQQEISYHYQRLINIIKECEENDSYGKLEIEFRKLNDSEFDKLSEYIQDEIIKWYFESMSYFFIRYIFEEYRFYINIKELKGVDDTPLLCLLNKGFDNNTFYSCLHSFFIRDYHPVQEDSRVISNYIMHLLKKDSLDDDERNELEKHVITLQYIRLYEANINSFDIIYNGKTKAFILRILSVLSNRIIGSSQSNFKSMTNNVIQFNKEYLHLFIAAMRSERGLKNDYGKNGEKLLSLFNKDLLNHDLDNVFPAIFPNINWKEGIEKLTND